MSVVVTGWSSMVLVRFRMLRLLRRLGRGRVEEPTARTPVVDVDWRVGELRAGGVSTLIAAPLLLFFSCLEKGKSKIIIFQFSGPQYS